jgi:hypothetical protein
MGNCALARLSLSQARLDGMPLHFDGDFGPFGSNAGLALTRTRKVWCGVVSDDYMTRRPLNRGIADVVRTRVALLEHGPQRAIMFRKADLLDRIRNSMRPRCAKDDCDLDPESCVGNALARA